MTLLDRPWVVAVAVVYLVVVLLIGLWSALRTRTARDFFIAGQRVGLFVTGLATMSAAFSGFVFLGGPGLTYRIGLASLMIVLPLGFTGGMLCAVVGERLRALAAVREVYTLPDAIALRFRSSTVTGLAALAVLSGCVAYLGLQLQALGVLLRAIFGTAELLPPLLLGLAVLVAYSVLGGMIAGVYTDLFQGTLMLFVAVVVFGVALDAAGGWGEALRGIGAAPQFGPSFLEPLGRVPVLTAFGFFFVFGIGVLGQPQMLHKFYMLDDARKLRWMPVVLGASQALCVLLWLGVGVAVPALVAGGAMPALERPDDAAPLFLLRFAPDVVTGLAFAGILAAIMSTADSLVNIGSAALVRDLPRALGRTVRHELRWARLALVLLAGLAAALAYLWGDLIAMLGTFAFGTFGAALAPCLALGLNWRRVTARAAGASIVTGLVLSIGLELLDRGLLGPGRTRLPLAEGALPAAVALAASFTVLVVGTLLTRPRAGEAPDPDVRAALRL